MIAPNRRARGPEPVHDLKREEPPPQPGAQAAGPQGGGSEGAAHDPRRVVRHETERREASIHESQWALPGEDVAAQNLPLGV